MSGLGERAGAGDAHWTAVAEHWAVDCPQPLWRAHADRVGARLMARWLPATARRVLKTDLFDEAVGTGIVPVLRAPGRQVVGIDLAVPILRAAEARLPGLNAVAADVRAMPFEDASFDAVISLSTLDHFDAVAEIDLALAEIARVTAPGGRLVLTLDNPLNPLVALRQALGPGVTQRLGLVPYHCGPTLAPRALARALMRAGFAVRAQGATLHCPRVLAVALARLVERRAGARGQAAFSSALMRFEALGGWPTRWITGHFSALLAERIG